MMLSKFVRASLFAAILLIALDLCLAQNPNRASVSAASGSRIIPPASSYHFPESETLVYSVEWHSINAGTATVNRKRQGDSEHLRSIANTSGIVNKIFPVHDIFDADIDTRNFCTQQISKHSEEGARRIERNVHPNYQTRKSHMEETDLKTGNKRKADFDIPPCVTDVVSGFFYAASLDLAPGSSQTFPVNDGGKTTDVKIEVEGRNRIKVPFGEFQALRVKAQPISGPLAGRGVLWVWFTDDGRHIPLQLKSKLGFATLLFQLQRLDLPKAHSSP
ncbi:MAG TPA: DUF3108 domain-containing protein [Chthoniobacterales bacterium]|jgi:hypothetical protein